MDTATAAEPRLSAGGVGRRVLRHVGLIVLFALPAVVLWWHAWDGHLGSTLACGCGDPGQQAWFVAWPAYALAHLESPFFSHAVYSPQGANILASTSTLFMGTLVSPVTWLFGPIVATNVVLTLVPALSAWACFVAARRFTAWWPAAAFGALVFGYWPFVVLGNAFGDVQAALLVVPPLALVVGYELAVAQRGPAWRWGVALGLLVTAQFFIGTEVLAIMGLTGAVAVVLWLVLVRRDAVPRLAYLGRGLTWAGVVTAVLCAYPAWYSIEGPRTVHGAPFFKIEAQDLELGNLVDPGRYRAHSAALRIGGYFGHQGPPSEFLGILTLVLVVGGLVLTYRRRLTRTLGWTMLISIILALGVGGASAISWYPWNFFDKLPLLVRVAPFRLMCAVDLCAALLIALGLDEAWRRWGRPGRAGRRRGRDRLIMTLVAVLCVGAVAEVWTTYDVPLQTQTVKLPPWFSSVATKVAPGTVVLAYPFPMSASGASQSMVWQAVDGMRFNLVGGYLKVPGAGGHALRRGPPDSAYNTLGGLTLELLGPLPLGDPPSIANLRAAIVGWRVDDVVVTDQGAAPVYATAFLTAAIGRAPTISHGAWVWNVHRRPPARATPISIAAAALALETCAPRPRYGQVPAGRPLPLTLARCVARHIAAGG